MKNMVRMLTIVTSLAFFFNETSLTCTESNNNVRAEMISAIQFVFEIKRREYYDQELWNSIVTHALQLTQAIQEKRTEIVQTLLEKIHEIYIQAQHADCFDGFISFNLSEEHNALALTPDCTLNTNELTAQTITGIKFTLEFHRDTQEYDVKTWQQVIDLALNACMQLHENNEPAFDNSYDMIHTMYSALKGLSWIQAIIHTVYAQTIVVDLTSNTTSTKTNELLIKRSLKLEEDNDDAAGDTRACLCEGACHVCEGEWSEEEWDDENTEKNIEAIPLNEE